MKTSTFSARFRAWPLAKMSALAALALLFVCSLSAIATQLSPQTRRALIAHLPSRWTPRAGMTFTVNSTADTPDATPGDGICGPSAGPCTLRAAIEEANANAGVDTINFNIPGGVQTIAPATALPAISETVTIDGTTQPNSVKNTNATGGLNSTLPVVLNGNASIIAGFDVNAPNCQIRGLVIQNFSAQMGLNALHSGVRLESGASGSQIAGCFFGTNAAGTAAQFNDSDIDVEGGNNYTIGGLNAADRNLMLGDGPYGALVSNSASGSAATPSLTMQGNLVGLVKAGNATIGTSRGLSLNNAPFVVIGGTTAAARNVISTAVGNGSIVLSGSSSNAMIQGNYFGTDATGMSSIAGSLSGAGLQIYTSNNLLGGAVARSRYLFSGSGVLFSTPSATNTVQGNTFGLNAAGTAVLDNNNGGLVLSGSGNTIGGTSALARNIFAVKSGSGGAISLTSASNNMNSGQLSESECSGQRHPSGEHFW